MNERAGMTIRRAATSDIERLAFLRVELLMEMGGRRGDDDAKELAGAARSYFESSIPTEAFVAFVAEMDGEIVGMSGIVIHSNPPVFGNPEGKEAYIMNMYTLPAHRHKGIATRLFEDSLRFIKLKEIRSVWLRASRFGKPLYKKFGFKGSSEYEYMELKLG